MTVRVTKLSTGMKIKLENKLRHSIINSKMIRRFIKTKDKGTIFVCQITEDSLKVIKCLLNNRQFIGLEIEAIPPDIDAKILTERLIQVFKKLEYNNNPVVISLPRSKVTCRYLKVPTQIPKEIDKIVSLQASRYLPYPAAELIIGYQVLSNDKEGYSDINLIIVHKDVVSRFIRIFKELKAPKVTIALSSYGLANFYDYIKPEETEVVMIIDINYQQVELAILSHKKLLFSRYCKIDRSVLNWENLFIGEIDKTRDAYLKEVAKEVPSKTVVIGAGKTYQEFASMLNKQADLPVEVLSYDKINMPEDLLNRILSSDSSFASLVGLGLKDIDESLNLLPRDIKEKIGMLAQRQEQLRLILLISSIIFILGLGIARHLDNKTRYLNQLKIELNKIAKDARALEEIEKRLRFMERRSEKKLSSLNLLYELHQSIPPQISLINLSYEEDNQVILRGQTPELNSVFVFVSQLGKSPIFRNFNIKVRYATKKKTQAGEVVDFEIVCLKK